MNLKHFLFLGAVLSTLFLFSFSKAVSKSGLPSSSYSIGITSVHNLPLIKKDTGGRMVNLDSAQACINRFPAEMKKHGFSDKAGEAVNIHIKKTSQITTGEAFSGKALKEWLNSTAEAYTAAGKTLMINIQLGVYDSDYLNTYQPNAAMRNNNNNRIAIFLIPYDSASPGLAARALVTPNGSGGTGTGGGTGFDLGGLQP